MSDTIQAESQPEKVNESRDRHLFGPGPKRVLALDGGGVRGAISVAFLERIEEIFAERDYENYLQTPEGRAASATAREGKRKHFAATVRLCDHFDLVGGTSTGALIAGALSLGFRTDEIKKFYLERAKVIFRRPIWRIPGLQAKFDARGLQEEIDKVVEQRTLDSPDLLTGLCIVTKRMDTGSPWIITNNPRAPYWETKPRDQDGPGHIGNRHYKLATLVRASTAAPHFFDPEIVQIIAEEEKRHLPPEQKAKEAQQGDAARKAGKVQEWLACVNTYLSRFPRLTMWLTKLRALLLVGSKGPSPETHGLFVDGGVTPFNNPSVALLMQVVLKPYKIYWPLGPDELAFVSIGTGSYRARLSFKNLGFAGPLKLALHSLLSMMGDTQSHALAQMQWLGECPNPWVINSEIGDLASELPPGRRWFRFMRYDVRLERDWINKELLKDLPDDIVAGYRNMDDPKIIEHIYALAVEAAKIQVKPEHFFPVRARDDAATGA